MVRLQTRSLHLDPLVRDDYPWLCTLYADPEVMRYIGTGVRTEAQVRKNLDGLLAQAERLRYGYWVLRGRSSDERLGGAALMVRHEGAPVELGFLLARTAWGQGLASEAASALVDHAFDALEVPALQAFTDPRNRASMAVLVKAGLRDVGLATGPYGSQDRKFVLTRPQWLAARAGP